MKPKRIRLSRAKGWRLPKNAVNVARPGPWGNPFVVGPHGTRADCVRLYEALMAGFICVSDGPPIAVQRKALRYAVKWIEVLRGKDLACWCALDGKPCHADVLLQAANGTKRRSKA